MPNYVATRGASYNAPINGDRIGVPVIVETEYQFATGVGPAQNDTFDVGYWPAGHVLEPDLCRVRFEELDSNASPTGTMDVGTEDDGDLLFDGIALGGGSAFYNHEPNVLTGYNAAASDVDRKIVASLPTAIATAVTGKKIVWKLAFRPVHA